MKEAESARFNRTHSAASQLSTRTCSFPRSILPTFSHPGQAPGQSHLRARAIRYKPPFPRAHNKGCDVFARVNDAQTSYRVTFNEDTHRKKPLRFIFIKISRSALCSTCSAERFVFPRTRMSSTWDKQVQVTFRGVSLANDELNFQTFSFVINPRSTLFRYWETVSSICIFVTCLIVPFQASFYSQCSTLWALAYIFDALYLVDVLLRFWVGYFSKGTLITDRSLIRRRYLCGMFIPDLLTLVPLDLLAFGVGTHLRWHQTLTLLRLNRILRVLRLLSFFGRLHICCLIFV